MSKKTDDELFGIAFRQLHAMSEVLKARGIEPMERFAIMFAAMQDLQAVDLGIGSSEHEETLALQHESLADGLRDLRAGRTAAAPVDSQASSDSLLLLDRSRGVVHHKSCRGLLAVRSPVFEPFVGLGQRALAGELELCLCCQALAVGAVARLLAECRISDASTRLARDLAKVAKAFDAAAEAWATSAAVAPTLGTRSDH